MHWRLNKYVVENTVDYLRRIFSYNKEWANKDIEFVKFEEKDESTVYEQFAHTNEKYPAITIGMGGGTFQSTGFNDLVKSVTDDIVQLGITKASASLINDIWSLKSKLPPLDGVTLRGLELESAWNGIGTGGDNIDVKIYKNYQTASASIVASASISGHTSRNFVSKYAEFSPQVTLDTSTYHLVFESTADSPYYLCTDPNILNAYLYNNLGSDIQASGSVVTNLYLPAFLRIGGNFKGSLVIRAMDKNDTKTPYTLSELISIYLTLAKHAQINRHSTAIDGMSLSQIDNTYIAEFMSKGIFIDQIRIGTLETRKRSDKENIYTVSVTVDFLTEWFQDFPADTITDINVLIKTFIEDSYTKVWSSSDI
jgi:hypothetical protein